MVKKFEVPIQVRFSDLDAMGHVNNAVYFSYFEIGRLLFFKEILKVTSPKEFPFILAKCEANYYIPVDLKTPPITLQLWAGDFGKKSFKFFYNLTDKDYTNKYADGFSVQVFYDYNLNKSVEIPEDFISKIKDYIEK